MKAERHQGEAIVMLKATHDVDAWFELSQAERLRLGGSLVTTLGEAWELASEQTAPHVRLQHRTTNLTFLLVPGGTMRMGLQESEIALVYRYVGRRPHVLEQIRQFQQFAAPVREVRVSPFLCGERRLKQIQVAAFSPALKDDADDCGHMHRAEALTLSSERGFRLPSDAELEWLARQGRGAPFTLDCAFEAPEEDEENVVIADQPIVARFGIEDLFETQWAADDWFPDHADRPLTSVARMNGDPQGVRRFEEFDFTEYGPESVIHEFSARRDPGRKWRAAVRFALGLPAAFAGSGD
jgi:formylglycine-generating enzyme required for sulfatase activity